MDSFRLITVAAAGAVLAVGAGAPPAAAQDDIEALGRELSGARPPVQYYETIRRIPHLFTFSAENGWLRRGQAVASDRAAWRSAAVASPTVGRAALDPSGALAGDLHVPVFLALYANTDSAQTVGLVPRSALETRLYGTDPAPPYSVHTYYREISRDRLRVNGTVFDWVRVSENDTHYEGGCSGLCLAGDMPGLLRELVELHDGDVDFGQFDNDGPDGIPNSGDDDGVVDAVVILHPEVDGACGTGNIWAHRASYAAWTGGTLSTEDDVQVNDYIVQGGQGGDSGCAPGLPQAMGVVAHETGHLFGLPDLYNTNRFRNSEGIGHWGLMGSGNWRTPTTPAHMEAWSLAELGWVTEVVVPADTTLVVAPIQDTDTAFVVPLPDTDEYFLLENRQPLGSDEDLWGPGLLVWHVSPTLVAERRGTNQVNAFEPEGLVLEQADGSRDLQVGTNRGDARDPFPGQLERDRFAHDTEPPTTNSDGFPTYVVFDSIAVVGADGAVRVRVRYGSPTLVSSNDTLAVFRLNGTPFGHFHDVLENGDEYQLEMDSVQTTADGRTRFFWRSWSNGGARAHTFAASPAGDTILATVDAEHRLLVTLEGPAGVVRADPDLDVTAGAWTPPGQVVTLIGETTEPGTVFDGWLGDRTSLEDTLVVTMDGPHDLRAVFADVLVMGDEEPPPAVMGVAYRVQLTATGGNGSLAWQRLSGELPRGLTLLSTGVLSGRPAETGRFTVEVEVRSGSQTAVRIVVLDVTAPALVPDDVVAHLLGAAQPLTDDEVRFLDLLGNENGRLDVGDFLAWARREGVAAPAALLNGAGPEARP